MPKPSVVLTLAVSTLFLGPARTAEPGAQAALRDCGESPQWEMPCGIDLPDPRGPIDDHGTPTEWRTYRLPEECTDLAGLECGRLPSIGLRWCLAAKSACDRAGLPAAAGDTVERDHVSDYDFTSIPLDDLPHGFACSGLLSNDRVEWCEYAEAMFPDASMLEGLAWELDWNFPEIDDREPPGCRMHAGGCLQAGPGEDRVCFSGRVVREGSGVRCEGDEPPEFSLGEIAFADPDGDGTRDAVMKFGWWGGGSGSTGYSIALTRRTPGAPWTRADRPTPGFDCERASTTIERAICDSRALSIQDSRMSRLYGMLSTRFKGRPQGDTLRSAQRAFLKQRDRACGSAATAELEGCLLEQYEGRIEALRTLAWDSRCELYGLGEDEAKCSSARALPAFDRAGRARAARSPAEGG